MPRIHLKKEPKLDVKHKSYSYQNEAVSSIKNLDYAAIFHEQGLGKSKIAIDLMLYWLEKKTVDTALFVVKKSLLFNWENEIKTHTFMQPKILSQNRRANFYVFNSPSRLILTHYEVFVSEYKRISLFLECRDVAAILDESAKIKNPDSSITKTLFKLSSLFKKRVIMTGTPIANRPYDLWAQIWFLDQGKSLGNDFSDFKKKYDLTNKLYRDNDQKKEFELRLQELKSKISNFSVREIKHNGVIELPEKVIQNIETDWENTQYEIYHRIKEEMRAIVIKEGLPTEDISDVVVKRLLRLVQVASNPRLIDESYISTPGKLEVLKDLVLTIVKKREKCIIWTSFTENVGWLGRELNKYGVSVVHGKLTMEKRNKSLASFLKDEDVKILISTPGAAKEGLTLTVANNVIFYDRVFSLDDYLQAQDRIHRISQSKTCYIYNLIMKESIDEWVDVLLESKHLAAQLAQGDISIDYYKSKMSYAFGAIIRDILGID